MLRAVILILAAHAALCGAFRAPAALRRASSPSLVARSLLRMSEPEAEVGLKFDELPDDIDDAPALSQQEALEIAMGWKVDESDASAPTVEITATPAKPALRAESELSEIELRDRKRMEAVMKYAPWMADSVTPEAIAAREAAELVRKNRKVEKLVGNRIDPAKQEIAGSGLKIRVSTGDEGGKVALEWSTGGEESNLGFIVSRKGAKDDDFVELASHENFQALRSKGAAGGQYTFTDEDVPPGGYLYKVQDVAVDSKFMTEVCRKGVDVETLSDQTNTVALVAGFLAFTAILFAVTNMLDPQ